MIKHDQALAKILQELSERGFVKLADKNKLRGLTEDDLLRAQKLEELIDADVIEKIKDLGHFESQTFNRFADLYYLSPHVSGKTPEPLDLERLERIDHFDLVIADFKGFCLYVKNILKIVE